MPTDKDLNQLIINKLTQQQYDSIANPSADEIYVLTDGKVSADDVDDTNTTNKFVTSTEKTTWNAKEDNSNKVTTIDTSNPSSTKYPSESAVVTYVSGIVGNIATILDSINGEVV